MHYHSTQQLKTNYHQISKKQTHNKSYSNNLSNPKKYPKKLSQILNNKTLFNSNLENSQRKSSAPTSAQQQLPEPNNKAPKPITQTKIRKTHCNLDCITIPNKPHIIQQLYLSHNNIRSVKNILRLFTSLRNLNLSYNMLSNVQQFIDQILTNHPHQHQDSTSTVPKISPSIFRNHLNLKMLNIRMNKFPYGYEDQLIKNISSLERFEDYVFKSIENDIMLSELKLKQDAITQKERMQIFYTAGKISQYFLPAYCRIQYCIQTIISFIESINKRKINKRNQLTNKSKLIHDKYEKCISKLAVLIHPEKQCRYLPDNRLVILQSILQYEVICLELEKYDGENGQIINGWNWQNKEESTYKKHIAKAFQTVLKQILIKFNQRNNYELISTLKRYIEQHQLRKPTTVHQPPLESQHIQKQIDNLELLANAFGSLYGARRFTVYEPNPGKYLDKVRVKEVKQHPFLSYVKFDKQQRYKNMNTLDGDRRTTKNTIMKQLEQLATVSKQKTQNEEQSSLQDNYFENIPIIVFQRNYLEIIKNVWEEKIKQFLRIYDVFGRMQNNDNKDVLYCQQQDSLQQLNKINISNSQNLQSQQSQPNNRNSRKKKVSFLQKQQKQQQHLIKKENQQNQQENSQSVGTKENNYGGKDKKKSMEVTFDHNVFGEEKIMNGQEKRKKSEIKLIKKQNSEINNLRQSTNLNKYTIYQINLAYKVFRALKKHKNKSKKKKSIVHC